MAAWNCFCNFAFVFGSFFRVGVRRRGIWKDIIPVLEFSKNQATDNGQKNAYVHGMLSSDIYHIGRRQLFIK